MSRSKVLLVAVVIAVLAGGAAHRWPPSEGVRQAPAPEPQALGPTTSHDLEFVPVDPCRARHPPGRDRRCQRDAELPRHRERAGFLAQGGTSGGCGVPDGKLAAELTIISADATGPGFLRRTCSAVGRRRRSSPTRTA